MVPTVIERNAMSQELKNSSGSVGTTSYISQYAEEIERLIGWEEATNIFSTDNTIEDPSVFALENHLEDFLVKNWHQTELGIDYEYFKKMANLSAAISTGYRSIRYLSD